MDKERSSEVGDNLEYRGVLRNRGDLLERRVGTYPEVQLRFIAGLPVSSAAGSTAARTPENRRPSAAGTSTSRTARR